MVELNKELYSGIIEIELKDEELSWFYSQEHNNQFDVFFKYKYCDLDLKQNQYILFKNIQQKGTKNEEINYLERYRFNGHKLVHFKNKTIHNEYTKKLKPKNFKQQCCFDLLQNEKVPVKLITGLQGSGKTFLSIHYSLQQYNEKGRKIIYARNAIDLKHTKDLGAMPGELNSKFKMWALPVADCIGNIEALRTLEEEDGIELSPLNFLRGRSFSNSTIVVTEAENLTDEHIKLLIGRVGINSEIIFEGDTDQVDKKIFEQQSGINALKNVLGGHELFGHVHLDKSERSKVSQLASLF